jgi:hypothetical protein
MAAVPNSPTAELYLLPCKRIYAFFQEDNAAVCTTNSFMLFCRVYLVTKQSADYGLLVCHVGTTAVGFYLWDVLENKAYSNSA